VREFANMIQLDLGVKNVANWEKVEIHYVNTCCEKVSAKNVI
jgi:hypothetical protein